MRGCLLPYLAFFGAAFFYAWPWAVFSGSLRGNIGYPWLACALSLTVLVIAGAYKARQDKEKK